MNIFVILKQTFDTEEKISIEDGKIAEDGVKFIINPYDEYALEEALLMREDFGGEITVLTMGSEEAEEVLRKALAMGVDHAIHFKDLTFVGDEYKTSKLLAEFIKKLQYDIILSGNQSIDNGAGQVAVRVAELLGIPHISTVTKVEIDGERLTAHRDAEGDVEIVESVLPVLITAQQGLNEPRYPSLMGIRKASKAPLKVVTASDFKVTTRSKSEIVETFLPKAKAAGRFLEGETIETRVKELISILRRENKVI